MTKQILTNSHCLILDILDQGLIMRKIQKRRTMLSLKNMQGLMGASLKLDNGSIEMQTYQVSVKS